jgi:hypothetical protein
LEDILPIFELFFLLEIPFLSSLANGIRPWLT